MNDESSPFDLVSASAHELRGPLTVLALRLRSAQHVVKGANAAEASDRLRSCERQVYRLERLIEGMHELARILEHRLELELEEVDLAEAVARPARARSANRPELRSEIAGPIVGRWDPRRLDLIIENLLASAARYAGEDPIELFTRSIDNRGELSVVTGAISFDLASLTPRVDYEFFVARALVEAHSGSISLSGTSRTTITAILPLRSEP